ncbi:putative nucleolar complex protein 14 [Mycena venus]|uniref:Putative nucleolar complex protein 14 n=1 Tax=Mycena venus TaxID=2733690 RepID=A0A8H7CYP1_9AGAR|nr:putative nucleolar complex protein 14 [Mycena venus]
MAKGSQLSQLKSALSQAGVTGHQQNGKKRKRTAGSQEKDKEKRAAKLEEIHKKLNPFDTKVTKLKHEVGGRKLKGVTGKPSQSKQAGLEQRKKTLLVEYEEKGRAGGIVDRRFGENDPTMSLEERMLERFTKERQRSSRGTAFNLEDEDELTHYGQSLSKLDDFDNVGLRLEDDEETGQLAPDVVGKTHFGGFSDEDEDEDEDEQPERKKSKAEVMAEVMAKSKEHKLRRQMEREEEDNVRHELDQEFDSLRDLIYAPDPSASGSNSIPLGPGAAPKPVELESHDVDYDQRVRELAFDARAKPKDRTKTEEEVALAEKEALEKAERRRRKRMLGLDESDSEDEDGRSRKKRKRGGDDLEDDFDDEEGWNGIGTGLGDQVPAVAGEDADSSGSEGEDDGEEDEEDDDEESDGQQDDEEESEVEGDHEELIASAKPSAKRKSKTRDKELPFTFPCPASHEELLEILEDVDDKDVPTVIQRIRALYHTSLAPENKFKLQTLTSVIIDHLLYISSPPEPHFDLVSSLLPHLFVLTGSYPIQAAENFVSKLSLMHKNLRRGLSRGALDPQSKTWPGLSELTLLRIIGATWPTSDLHHAVVSPTRVLMGAYLGLARVRSLADIASGLFLCTLFLQFEQLSKRLVPEAVNFAVNSVLHLAPHRYEDVAALPGAFPAPDFRSELCRGLSLDAKKAKTKAIPKAELVALLTAEEPTEEGKAQLLGLTVDLLGRFADMYKGLEGFIELYEPVLEILLHIREQIGAGSIQARLTTVSDSIRRLLKFSREARQPLLLQAHKPIPIPTYIPKFETSKSSYLRRQDPDHERNEAAKLRNQYKQERKGAIRELRKDARFLAGVEQKKQAEKDRMYNESLKKVYGSIQTERAEEKAMEREKSREKKRAGRK